MIKKLIFILVYSLLVHNLSNAQSTYKTESLVERIRTLTVYPNGVWNLEPVILINSDNRIQISFDEMSHDYKKFSYRIFHCNADWSKSDLNQLEYMEGFSENDIDSAEQSIGTLTLYTHYSFCIPNDNVKLRLSGNYLVEIFDRYGSGETVARACFSVNEAKTILNASVSGITDIDFREKHQQLQLDVRPLGLTVFQPQKEIKVVVRQNRRTDNEVTQIEPSNINGDKLEYQHIRKLIFEAGNEYRRFEMLTYKHPGLNINRIEYFKPFYNVELLPSTLRTSGYSFEFDQNGRYYIRTQDGMDSGSGSDYFLVHFSLPMEKPMLEGSIFVYGNLTGYEINPDTRMEYDFETKTYNKTLLLKQGGYSYQCIFRPAGKQSLTLEPLEGSYWQTENEYNIFIYYRPVGERYDRLIGYKSQKTAF